MNTLQEEKSSLLVTIEEYNWNLILKPHLSICLAITVGNTNNAL